MNKINTVQDGDRISAETMNSIIDLLNELAIDIDRLKHDCDKIKEKIDIYQVSMPEMKKVEEAFECEDMEKSSK